MEKLESFIKSFRISDSTKKILIEWSFSDDVKINQLCRRIINKAAKEYEKNKKEGIKN